MSASYPIPTEHLSDLLAGWSGEGTLMSALAAVESDTNGSLTGIEWSEADIKRRAHRVLLEMLRPRIAAWPTREREWTNALPAVTTSRRVVSDRPLRPTNWNQTRRRYGWPPAAFVGVDRMTQADELLVNLMAWTVAQVTETARLAEQASDSVTRDIKRQIDVAAFVSRDLPTDGPAPTEADVLAASRAGHPWNVLAPVSAQYLRYHGRLDVLALELIAPSAELRWRLFHIAVLGELLAALRGVGGSVRWLAPLSGSSRSPQYLVDVPGAGPLELWFEATSAWKAHGAVPPYPEARRALSSGAKALGPDLLLLDSFGRALVLECKYGPALYVGRNGYLQAVAYAAEARAAGLADVVWSYVVGPEGVVLGESHTVRHRDYMAERVGVTSPTGIAGIVGEFLAATPAS